MANKGILVVAVSQRGALPPATYELVTAGRKLAAFSITESSAGSDATATKCTAKLDGEQSPFMPGFVNCG